MVDFLVILDYINANDKVGDYRNLEETEFWSNISYDS